MSKFKNFLGTFILCYGFWMLFTIPSTFDTEELLMGAVVSIIIALFCTPFFSKVNGLWLFKPKHLIALIEFIPVYTIELFKANWDVAKRALSPEMKINPGIVKIQTDIKSDYGLSLLSNCITLTPGTITMDIVEEEGKNYLYIHWIDVSTQDINKASDAIAGAFQPWVRRIFENER